VKCNWKHIVNTQLEGEKKTKKPIKLKKLKKKIIEKTEPYRLNRLKFWKNQPVRFSFDFISLKPKKPSQPGLNQFLSKKPNRTETGQFEPVSVQFRFFLIWFSYFFNKNWTEPKMIVPTHNQKESMTKLQTNNQYTLSL
jgi:hypothetical protein